MSGETGEVVIDTNDPAGWFSKGLAGHLARLLWKDPETQGSIAMVSFEKGSGIPGAHYHPSTQFMLCLKGRYEYTATGIVLTPGSFYINPKGHVHGPTVAHEDTLLLEIYDGPDYVRKPDYYAEGTKP
jgi:quercetin dioxygenase-like cupin family protein